MEMWAGFECTLNRVGDRYQDQLLPEERNMRTACLRALPGSGITGFRYRVAWEDVTTPWEWVEDDLKFLQANGIKPIIGLVHHGSGPEHTSLLADDFAEGLASHAHKIVRLLPHVEYWTPVNEPLTTARFSALYGHWYPHERSDTAFWLALLNQTDATIAAMREIRAVNPGAKLIQTEDLGTTFATAALADQAAHDNQRRWMTWDLLCGLVVEGHPFYDGLCKLGFRTRLDAIAETPCPPDIVGVNHYLTSDRFLDHRISRYPATSIGANRQQRFADVEAVRVLSAPHDGIKHALSEAWDRYNIPVVLTECHNGCTREEQMRWVRDAWDSGLELKADGKDIRAITIWTLMGARGWSNLLTQPSDDFEGGVFDPRSSTLRPTGLAETISAISQSRPLPAAVAGPGWWQREDRLKYDPAPVARPMVRARSPERRAPLLIAGITGSLGKALAVAARHRGLHVITTSRSEMSLQDVPNIRQTLQRYQPWAVINATGWVKVDEAEDAVKPCLATNTDGALALALCCEELGLPNVHFSSDLVFDGKMPVPYKEGAATSPLNVYGESKALADAMLLQMAQPLVIRTAAFFSPFDPYNFAHHLVSTLRRGETFLASATHQVSPTYVPHLANIVLDLTIDRAHGLWHISNGSTLSWLEFGRELASVCRLDAQHIIAASPEELGWKATRPVQSGLHSMHGQIIPRLGPAFDAFVKHMAA
ncbi:sugar nucleotide-binding protein [Sphingorhabdus sp.]|uniref:sugar nucleotide-binding protein n=1 Tax=Sphingorhabdus sp. TaxID=1902408 RepID=UPI00391AD880